MIPARPRAPLALALLLMGSLGACGGHSSATPDAAIAADAGTASLDGFCRAASTRICAGLATCGCRFDVRPYDAAGCVDARTSDCELQLTSLGPNLASGVIQLDPPSIDRCLAAIERVTSACALTSTNDPGRLPIECDSVVVDVAIPGARCNATAFGGDFYCDHADGLCPVMEGQRPICTPLPPAGQPCLDAVCQRGLVCNTGTCALPAGDGAACDVTEHCAAGLVCAPGRHCAAPLADGVACQNDDQCQLGHRCDASMCAPGVDLGAACVNPSDCGAERSCGHAPETRVCGDPGSVGATCTTDSCAAGLACAAATRTCVVSPIGGEPCLDGACADAFGCVNADGLCHPLPGPGETCFVGAHFCAAGLGCDTTTNTCQPGPGDGATCLYDPPAFLCAAGLGCDFTAMGSVCVVPRGVGGVCQNDFVCDAGLYCTFSSPGCQPRIGAGGACPHGNECATGLACNGTPTGPRCVPIPGRAEPCDAVCGPGLACQGPGGKCVVPLCVMP